MRKEKKIVFETLRAMFVAVLTYVITYFITESIETSIAVVFAAAVFAKEHKVKYWKVLLVYLSEGLLLCFCFMYFVPFSAIALLCVVLLGLLSFAIAHYLKRYLENYPPQELKNESQFIPKDGPFRGYCKDNYLKESRRARLYRALYNRLIPQKLIPQEE